MSDAVSRLDPAVDPIRDHVLGSVHAPITLVEYGSYDCPHCRAANEEIAKLRDRFGDRMRYVFRQRPITGSRLARRAAELVEQAPNEDRFWDAHVALMTRSASLRDDDLSAVETLIETSPDTISPHVRSISLPRARQKVDADIESARASGAQMTPTFFINGRRYDGPWDAHTLGEAMLGSLGHRVQSAALDFASWAPSTGLLLLLATVLAVAITNSPFGPVFQGFWQMDGAFELSGHRFGLSLRDWVNDALLSIFFLVVGLEIKREFTIGHLAGVRLAVLPIAAAVGGMAMPAALYFAVARDSVWAHGWGIPMATDTAFAVALIVVLGRRVPIELRIFLTAVAIVDDIGSIVVIALFYSEPLQFMPLVGAGIVVALLGLLNRSSVYRALPYALLGLLLWICVHAAGLHATLAAVLLAWFIPTRPAPNLRALTAQAQTVIEAAASRGDAVLRHGASISDLNTLDSIVDRLESPADRMLRTAEPWSSYLILPLFALANAGVVFSAQAVAGHASLQWAIALGLILGKPLGLLLGSALAVAIRVAVKPCAYSWVQLGGAGALAGIGFTMSLFIAGQALPAAVDFNAAKLAIFAASIVSAILGAVILWVARTPKPARTDRTETLGTALEDQKDGAEGRAAAEPLRIVVHLIRSFCRTFRRLVSRVPAAKVR